MSTFIKRLANNELGRTGGHQRGGILIPRNCINFFPPLGPDPNPEVSVGVRFTALRYPVTIRVIYYDQGTRNEYRLTPVPHEVLRNAHAGDFFVLREDAPGTYTGTDVPAASPLHADIHRDLGHAAGRITMKEYPTLFLPESGP